MTILLDMDGVLADFTSAAIDRLNKACDKKYTIEDYVSDFGQFEMAKLYNISNDRFWSIIEEGDDFWLKIKPFPWASSLVEKLKEIHEDVIIATSPSLNPSCAKQKLQWLNLYLGIKSDKAMIGPRKELMSCEDAILIDDYSKNIDKFNKGWGKGILIPSNWNTVDLTFDKVWSAITKEL